MVFSQKSGSSTSSWRGKSTSQSTSTQSTPKKRKQKSNSQPQKTDESSYVPVTDKQKASSVFEPLVPYDFETLYTSTESLKTAETSKAAETGKPAETVKTAETGKPTAKPEESHEEFSEIPDSQLPHLSSPLYATRQASEHSETTVKPSEDSTDKSKKASFDYSQFHKEEEPELPHLSSPLYATDSTEAAETTVRPYEEDTTGKDKPAASFDYKQYHYSTTESLLDSLKRETTTAKSSNQRSKFQVPYNYEHLHSSTTEGRIPRSSTATYSFGASEKIQTTVKPDDDSHKDKFSYSHFTPSWEFSYSKKTHSGEPDFFDHTTPTPNKDAKTSATKNKSAANRRSDDDSTTTATKSKNSKSKGNSKDGDAHHNDFFHNHHDYHHDDHDDQADKEHLEKEGLAPPESYFKDDAKFVEIDNPFADPNFDFDKFLTELKANPIEPTHQTLSNMQLLRRQPHNLQNLPPHLHQRLPANLQRLVPPPHQTAQPWLQTILQPQALNSETVKNPYSFDSMEFLSHTTKQPGKSYVTIPLVAQPINTYSSQTNRPPAQELSPPKPSNTGNLYSPHNRGPQTFGALQTFDYNIHGLKAPTLAPFTPVKTVSQPTYIPLKAAVKPTPNHEYYYDDDETTIAPKKLIPNQILPASNNQNAAAGKKPPQYDDYYYYEYYEYPEGKNNNTKVVPAKTNNEYYYDNGPIQKLPATNKLLEKAPLTSNPSVAPNKDFLSFPSIYSTAGYLFAPSTTIRPALSYDDTARYSTVRAITAAPINKGQRLTTTTPNLYTDFDSRRDQSNLYNR